ncbi:MAG: hypothetical protein ABJG15_01620 [Hyphomonadaceae bacterium]
MKTPIDTVTSTIIVQDQSANAANNATNGQSQVQRTPRAHIINRRAARWARRATH